jgi:hypothetical protein
MKPSQRYRLDRLARLLTAQRDWFPADITWDWPA